MSHVTLSLSDISLAWVLSIRASLNEDTPPFQACAPCNTPATPPSFPEALLALQKLQAGGSDWSTAASPPMPTHWQQPQQPTPKVLAMFNPMPPPSDR